MIDRIPFGSTGHLSSRAIFGAAALGAMKPERAMRTLELLLDYGVNHIDTAASYGDSELRLAPFLAEHRRDFFLATKTGQRTYSGAREELHRSLERLGTDSVDLIQMHNLVADRDWETAMGDDGALRALVEARDEGLVHNIGVTGHGTYVARAHMRSLDVFPFASVLCPYNFTMNGMGGPYAEDFEALYARCQTGGIAMQTIKSIARRRWRDDDDAPRYAWYMPITEESAMRRAVHFVLARPGLFLNTSSDATLLPLVLKFAAEPIEAPAREALLSDQQSLEAEPLFIRDQLDDVRA